MDSLIATRRAEMLMKALSLPLPDSVYQIVQFNHWAGPLNNIDLIELQSKGSDAELKEWEAKSHKLRRDAYAVGNAGLRRDGSYEKHRMRFELANPGFGKESYDSAVAFGYQEAR